VKLIVGLGNPGIEYQFTPHNMGFLTIDRLAERHNIDVCNRRCRTLTGKGVVASREVLLAKPETYMNLSGMAVRDLVQDLQLDPTQDLIVIYDELDLPLGMIRIRERGSAAGHNGMKSVIGALETDEFVRVRLGIGPNHPTMSGERYVLSQFKKSQYETIDRELDTGADAVETILKDGVSKAMNLFNRKPEEENV
jgi:PTH1 family peptidyl-tRNA hydrolase